MDTGRSSLILRSGRIAAWLADRRRFCALLGLIFLVRGVFVLSVLPPFEGWDEYQHLGYIAFLDETGRPPVLGVSLLPRSLIATVARYPHSKSGAEQVHSIGGLTYDDDWQNADSAIAIPDTGIPHLYQAQHPSLYYRMMLPLYRALWNADRPLTAITALRAVNILFGAGAAVVAALLICHLFPVGPHRFAAGLLLTLQPLFLVNSARIANDALAVFLGILATAVLLAVLPRRPLVGSLLAGLILGCAALTKAVTLALLPFALFVYASLWWHRRLRTKPAAIGAAILVVVFSAITASYFTSNIHTYGSLTPMQETIHNTEKGLGLSDYIVAAGDIDWRRHLTGLFMRHNLWVGGWSFLRPKSFWRSSHEYLAWAGVLGLCLALSAKRRRERWLFHEPGAFSRLGFLCLLVAAGLCYHLVQSQAAWGTVTTNSWYAAVCFPWLICLFYQGLNCLPGRWTVHTLAAAMMAVYLGAEIHGTMSVMVRAYTGESWGPVARQRLALLHPAGFGPAWTIPALIAALLLIALAVAVWMHAVRRQETRPASSVSD